MEAAGIAFPDPSSVEEVLRGHCVRLGLRNIRIIHRARRLALAIAAEIAEVDEKVLDQAPGTLAFFVWCRYSADGDAVDYEYAKSSNLHFAPESVQGEKSAEQREWDERLRELKVHAADEFDLTVAKVKESRVNAIRMPHYEINTSGDAG